MSKTITFGLPKAVASSFVNHAGDEQVKRLTIALTEDQHHRLKIGCATEKITIAELIRQVIDERFP